MGCHDTNPWYVETPCLVRVPNSHDEYDEDDDVAGMPFLACLTHGMS